MELLEMSAVEQARLVAGRQISSEELTRFYLQRIDRFNPELQAFVAVFRKEALWTARRRDAAVRAGARLAPFHGVPIGIKDISFIRGRMPRFGSRAFGPLWCPVDDASVAPLRRAGFVFMGRLATSELGAIPVTEPDIHPPTRNPWNRRHTPGGSSGGSASAVAAGLIPVAHASDGGGSIRIPAAFTGLVGLKPGRGRLPNPFWLPDRQVLYTTGALTRNVADTAALLDIMARITEGRPHWATPPPKPYAQLVQDKPRALRIRVTVDSHLTKTDPEVRSGILEVAATLSSLGHRVEEAVGPMAGIDEFVPLWGRMLGGMPLMRWSRAQPVTRWLKERGRGISMRRMEEMHLALERRMLNWFEGTDLWLTPTVPQLPPRIGQYAQEGSDPEQVFFKIAELAAFAAYANITGQPAISVPAGLSSGGLPFGAQLVGPLQDEAVLLQIARQLEEARPWRQRYLS